ncbi:MAG TPA: response regulator [Methylomirabilota bacterium]|nr:response regulator [Methylomirabilota bacterium]
MRQEATILLVEDDPNDILLMQRAFNKARLANPLEVVTDGEEAIAYLSGEGRFADRNRYPVPLMLLLDLKMPRRNGFEVLEWLKEHPEFNQIPVVVLTSSDQQPDVEKAFRLGARSYLTKPGRLEDLVSLMMRLQGYWLLLDRKPEKVEVLVSDDL